MGQSYYVKAKFNIKNEKEFISKGRKVFEDPNVCPIEEKEKDTAEHLIETLLVKKQGMYEKDGNKYSSQFDASYGWERVLSNFFEAVRETLNVGSYITVYPDYGSWTERVTK